ncbi:uncharacterized protein LOC126777599 [Nymphalis io]|uniref:uncharacterized protein LOC126777599 n=1 Tax=Inachis io TaxID=171585 RepID=UPI00216769CB|nr:uncharacterized protein LOC126777599 [Nymphalis io]
MKCMTLILTICVFIISAKCYDSEKISGNPLIHAHPCVGSENIVVSFEPGLAPEIENQYGVYITRDFISQSKIELTLDGRANVTLNDKGYARIYANDNKFEIRFFKEHDGVGFKVQGLPFARIPYITSLIINSKEFCSEPLWGYLDEYIIGYKNHAASK